MKHSMGSLDRDLLQHLLCAILMELVVDLGVMLHILHTGLSYMVLWSLEHHIEKQMKFL